MPTSAPEPHKHGAGASGQQHWRYVLLPVRSQYVRLYEYIYVESKRGDTLLEDRLISKWTRSLIYIDGLNTQKLFFKPYAAMFLNYPVAL